MSATQEYQEKEIVNLISRLTSLFSDIQDYHAMNPQEFQEEIDESSKQFKGLANLLYNLCSAHLESKNLPTYFSLFKEKVTPYYTNNKLMSGSYDEYADQVLSDLLSEYWRILHAFPAFNHTDSSTNKGYTYLEHILESTGVIVKKTGKTPKSEKDVYDAVKLVCEAVFSDFTHPTHSFQKTAKCYVPDILIPSLRCAIEYKYATTEQKLIDTIDQILIDVQGYSSNPSYNKFYAVFYVTPGIWSRKRFNEVWKEKAFPKYWQGIFVEGV